MATALHSSTRAAASALWGMVTEIPANPSARTPSSAPATRPGATSKAREVQLRSKTANAVLWSSGESEWRTG